MQKVKGQHHCDIKINEKTLFWPLFKRHNSGTEEKIIFHIWSDTESMTLILGALLETVVIL